MAAIEPLCSILNINPNKLAQEESLLLEAELITRICEELKEVFRNQYKEYFRLIKFTIEKENLMLENKLVRLIMQDLLSTDEYNLKGIAFYTGIHEDVLQDIYIGQNSSPSAALLRKIIELHRTVRGDLYRKITKKIVTEYLAIE